MVAAIIVKLVLLAIVGIIFGVGLMSWLNLRLAHDCDRNYRGDVDPHRLLSYAEHNVIGASLK